MVRPKGRSTKQLSEDDRKRIKILSADAHFTAREIQRITGYTESQIKYTLRHPDVTPKFKDRGRRKTTAEGSTHSNAPEDQGGVNSFDTIGWPASSPHDAVASIEWVWCCWLKDWVKEKRGQGGARAGDGDGEEEEEVETEATVDAAGQSRRWVKEAWASMDDERMRRLLGIGPRECEDAEDARGGAAAV
ncbi:unnamed protein product [Discula destructiva]